MRTPNEVQTEIMETIVPIAHDAYKAQIEALLTELVFASRALALSGTADAMQHLHADIYADAGQKTAEGWQRAIYFLEGKEWPA